MTRLENEFEFPLPEEEEFMGWTPGDMIWRRSPLGPDSRHAMGRCAGLGMYGDQRLILSPYTTDVWLDKLTEDGQFYDVTKLWRRLYDEHSNKKEEVDLVNKIEIVVWALKLEVYEGLYASVFEWIEPEPKPWELKSNMMSHVNLDVVEGHAFYKTFFREEEIVDTWWQWTHEPEDEAAVSSSDSDDVEGTYEEYLQRVAVAQQQMLNLLAHNRPSQ